MSSCSVCFTHTHLHTHPCLVHSVYCVRVVRKAWFVEAQAETELLGEDRKHKQVIVFVSEDVAGQRFQLGAGTGHVDTNSQGIMKPLPAMLVPSDRAVLGLLKRSDSLCLYSLLITVADCIVSCVCV